MKVINLNKYTKNKKDWKEVLIEKRKKESKEKKK